MSSAERLLTILDLFTEARLEWTADEIAEAQGLTRPTAYRYIKTLREAGFLTDGGHGLTLGPRVVELDYLMRKSDTLLREGEGALRHLASLHPATALLVRWYGNKLLCVASEVSARETRSSYPRGRPMPVGRGAISRAILAHLPRRQMVAKIEENLEDLRATGLGTTPEEIAERLRHLRKAGAIVAHGEVTPGVVGIAAPVFDGGSAPVAALCMTIDRATLDAARTRALSQEVWQAAQRLSGRLAVQRQDRAETETEFEVSDAV